MYSISKAKQQVLQELKVALGKTHVPSVDELEYPPESEMGDLAFPCFALAKGMKRNPKEIATELAAKIGPKKLISKVEAKGPYVNFTLDTASFGEAVLKEIGVAKEKYGQATSGSKKKILVEYAAPNTLKEIHVGHLRNFVLGNAYINILRAAGYEVIAASYINDLGSHIAKTLWAIKKFHADEKPEPEARQEFLNRAYIEANQAEEKDKKVKEEISQVYYELESGSRKWQALWKKTRKWSLEYIFGIFKELGLIKDVQYYESDLTKRTHKIVDELVKKGIAKESERAIIVDLEDEGLGANLLKRSDGTLLYNAKDLALAERKEDDYAPDRSVYVVDARQSLAMEQLFATLKRMGFSKNLQHLSYEFVTLKEGAMASRKGNVIRYEAFRNKMVELARSETLKRHKDWDEKKLEHTAASIAYAAMKFPMLKQDLDKTIVFDMEEAISFDGFSGPYILYTISRAKSILKKSKLKARVKGSVYTDPVEHALLVKLAEYPEVILAIASNNRVSTLPHFLFDLAQTFAEFYEKVPVLQAEDEEQIRARLALVESLKQVLENGLALLGIDSVEEM